MDVDNIEGNMILESVGYSRPSEDVLVIDTPGCLSLPNESDFADVEVLTVKGKAFDSDIDFFGSIARTYSRLRVLDLSAVSGIHIIGRRTFLDCESLEIVYLPEGVSTIEESAFEGCEMLSSVNLPSSLLTIGDKAFAHCSHLACIKLPEKLRIIGKKAFRDCNSISSISIPSSVDTIGALAFTYMTQLSEINVEKSNRSFKSDNGVLYDSVNSVLVYCPQRINTSKYKVLSGTRKIADRAFVHCSGIKKISLPDSIQEIGTEAFYFCSSLQKIVIPSSVSFIGISAFRECLQLEDFKVDENNPNFTSIDGVLYSGDKKQLMYYPCGKRKDSFDIPSFVDSILTYAFAGNSHIESISLSSSLLMEDTSIFGSFKVLNEIRSGNDLGDVSGFELKSNEKGLWIYKAPEKSFIDKMKHMLFD